MSEGKAVAALNPFLGSCRREWLVSIPGQMWGTQAQTPWPTCIMAQRCLLPRPGDASQEMVWCCKPTANVTGCPKPGESWSCQCRGQLGDITGSPGPAWGRLATLGGEKEIGTAEMLCDGVTIPSLSLTLGCRPCCGHNRHSHCSCLKKNEPAGYLQS